MLPWLRLILGSLLRLLRSRRDLLLENLVLRQQLAVLKQRRRRPSLLTSDKLFWVCVRRLWNGWQQSLAIVTPETVVRWHRAGFRLYWRWLSRHRVPAGRRPTSREVRELIFRMVAENPTWGAPRIHGELQMLGFDIAERTVSRWVRRAPRDPQPAKRWLAFLHNHRELIAAMDFFVVPTVTFGLLYCFFIIAHDRRRILHINVTRNPTSAWVMQQLREAFPYQSPHRYLIFDRDAKFSLDVTAAVRAMGTQPTRTSFRSPWQNGVAERWVGSCRRDLLDHVIVKDGRHLKRPLSDYVRYYHDDRTHLGLAKQTPGGRSRPAWPAAVRSAPRPGSAVYIIDTTSRPEVAAELTPWESPA